MRTFAEINVVACIYNLLPIPHSDGTRILALLSNTNAAVPQAMPEMQPRA
jgi:Zn-dependent protease